MSELSLEELKRQEESTRTVVRWSVLLFSVVIVLVFIWTFLKGYHLSNMMILVGLSFLFAFTADKLKKIRAEISSRV